MRQIANSLINDFNQNNSYKLSMINGVRLKNVE